MQNEKDYKNTVSLNKAEGVYGVKVDTDAMLETIDVFSNLSEKQMEAVKGELRVTVNSIAHKLCAIYGFSGIKRFGDNKSWLCPVCPEEKLNSGVSAEVLSRAVCISMDMFMKTKAIDECNRALVLAKRSPSTHHQKPG